VASPIIGEARVGQPDRLGKTLLPPDTEERLEKFSELVAPRFRMQKAGAAAASQADRRRVGRGAPPDRA
jgi:hypothetical protein